MRVYKSNLFKMVYGKPYFSLCIEHTAQVAPRHCKVGLSLYGFQVTSLCWVHNGKTTGQKKKR